ncbi:MAG: hypothetical protein AMXMBFR64_45240 [Myxococcales bacterium]
MRAFIGPVIIVGVLWGAILTPRAPPDPARALPTGCGWRRDPAVPGGAVCVTGVLGRLLPPLDAGQRLALGLALDVNASTAQDLETIPGVGERTARAIVEYRQAHGAFRTLDDLARVRGIGEGTIDKLRPYLTTGRQEERR